MLDTLKKALSDFGIDLVAGMPVSKCKIVRPYKLKHAGFDEDAPLSVIVFAIPYYTKQDRRNISAYAVSRDYHMFAKQLFDTIIPKMQHDFPSNRFAGFVDNSPISEVHAAAMAGLGVIGDNMMLITEKYSSYVFLGEIITDFPLSDNGNYEIKLCEHCGRCRATCPMGEIGECLSALTQKKGDLTEQEKGYILKYGSAWGCDICQEVCPHTLRAIQLGTIYSPIDFFKHDATPHLTSHDILSMSEERFAERAYSWRGRNTILRNLKMMEESKKGGES